MFGCEFCPDDCVKFAEDGPTGVPGVYVVGNASQGMQFIIAAAR